MNKGAGILFLSKKGTALGAPGMNSFYVYMYFWPTGLPCYVGKGTGKRWLYHLYPAATSRLGQLIRETGGEFPRVKIKEGLTSEEACAIEVALIETIGRQIDGGPLVNFTTGGEGLRGHQQSAEANLKRKASHAKFWASPEGIKRKEEKRLKGIAQMQCPKEIEKLRQRSFGNKFSLGRKHSEIARRTISENTAKANQIRLHTAQSREKHRLVMKVLWETRRDDMLARKGRS